MSYIGYEFMYDGTRAALWEYIQKALINMGWELHDNISATVQVYKSNGESGSELYGYIWIDAGTSTYIEFRAYQYWNSTTHAGVRLRYAGDYANSSRITATYLTSSYPGLIAGDKNVVTIVAHLAAVNASNNGIMFGHCPVRFDNNLAGAQGTAGTAGTITIAPSSYMGNGKNIQIVGGTGEGCDSLSISSAPDSATRIVLKLPRNYGTGSVIGAPASVFFITHLYTTYIFPVAMWGDSGTTVGSTYLNVYNLSTPAINNYDFYSEKRYYFVPYYIANLSASSPGQAMGCLGENILNGASVTVAMSSALFNNDGSVPEVSLVSLVEASTMSDIDKSWSVNEHAGRYCLITEGDGIGIIRKISSNTSDTLTLDSTWPANYTPRAGSIYRIADNAYRLIVGMFQNSTYIKITRTDAPS